jgi:dTDP-4-amino-4,6-dideoxygalactose transaminase
MVPRFEETVASYCGASYAVAVNSATSALHIACLALGVRPGDRAWTSPNTFVASANCAIYCGAEVDFVDIDPATYNISLSELSRKLAEADAQRRPAKSCNSCSLCRAKLRYGRHTGLGSGVWFSDS